MRSQSVETKRLLARLHSEVREFGKNPGEDFVRQDFFIGGADPDDTNKDIHVGILIRAEGRAEIMAIQVTRMEKSKDNPRIREARSTKAVSCVIGLEGVGVVSSDYPSGEVEALLKEILKAVTDKKKLLKR